jgi:hypothetical protein
MLIVTLVPRELDSRIKFNHKKISVLVANKTIIIRIEILNKL